MLDLVGWFLAEFVSLPSSALPALLNGPGLAMIGARVLWKFAIWYPPEDRIVNF